MQVCKAILRVLASIQKAKTSYFRYLVHLSNTEVPDRKTNVVKGNVIIVGVFHQNEDLPNAIIPKRVHI